MSRLDQLDPQNMSAEQRAVCDETLAGPRSKLPAPLKAWLFRPELARRGQSLGAYARYGTSLSPKLSELAILVTARFWASQYEWYAHKPEALAAGLEPEAIDRIEKGERPIFADAESMWVYAVTEQLYHERTLSDHTYEQAIAVLGRDRMIDLVAIAGYYSLVAMTLNVFDIGVPEGTAPPFGRHNRQGARP